MVQRNIVVIGAGVTGLTTALLLAKKDKKNVITIVAKYMPGDYDIEYTSPWAGADVTPFAKEGTNEARWEAETWPVLAELAANVPEAGIHFQKSRGYNRIQDIGKGLKKNTAGTNPWFKDVLPDFRVLSKEELPPGIDSGTEFTSVCINTALYLPYLVGQCRLHNIILKRAILSHITYAYSLHHTGNPADLIINCTGLMASTLGGVNDKSVIPARGQTVLVRNDGLLNCSSSGTDDGIEESCYTMTRASGGGTILGGSYQLGNWNGTPDLDLAARIMRRAVELNPNLTGGRDVEGLSVVRHAVGLRPYRAEGVRVEREVIDGMPVVHCYGHGGFGYQVSWACSGDVVKLVEEVFEEGKEKARL